ncbi:lipid IV(A) 4-amino-4-deoxy-L-arabinosyltransferase [Enterobacteriaceae bacterium LUAb1]
MPAMNRGTLLTPYRLCLFFLVLYILYYLLPLEFRALWQPDETRYAEISREMLASGDWVVPHFFGLRYFEKPVAGYWINNVSQWLFGHNNFAVRFGSVFSVTLTALVIYCMALRLWQRWVTALMASTIFLTSILVYGVGTYAVLDPMITLWLVAAMYLCWQALEADSRPKKGGMWLLFGAACGMGFMTKGFLALAVPVVAVLPWSIQQRRFSEVLCYGPLALLSAVLISAPWSVAIAYREADFWRYFFWVEHIQRFTADTAQHKAPFWYYLPVLALGCLPWLGLLPGAVRMGWRQRIQHPEGLWLLSWLAMPLLFFSLSKGKLPTYILPCFAPLAMLMARYVQSLAEKGSRLLRINGWINLLFGLLCTLVVLVFLAPWGVAKHPVYQLSEWPAVLLAASAFLLWALAGGITLKWPLQRWYLTALCPLFLALVAGSVMPHKVRDSKQSQWFIRTALPQLTQSHFVVVNNPGLAAAAAWELKRSNIILYKQPGELHYGLRYREASGRFITEQNFAAWLLQHRREGDVSLLLKFSVKNDSRDSILSRLPKYDAVRQQGRFMLVYYKQQP